MFQHRLVLLAVANRAVLVGVASDNKIWVVELQFIDLVLSEGAGAGAGLDWWKMEGPILSNAWVRVSE